MDLRVRGGRRSRYSNSELEEASSSSCGSEVGPPPAAEVVTVALRDADFWDALLAVAVEGRLSPDANIGSLVCFLPRLVDGKTGSPAVFRLAGPPPAIFFNIYGNVVWMKIGRFDPPIDLIQSVKWICGHLKKKQSMKQFKIPKSLFSTFLIIYLLCTR